MDAVHTTLGALVAGLVTSVHCLGMCGPIVCGMSAMPASDSQRTLGAVTYHVARLTSYALIGALCGAVGRQPLKWFFDSPLSVLPWVLVVVFLIFGFGLEKKLPRPVALLKWATRLKFHAARLNPVRRGAMMGLMTPLLPCGPLYLLFGASLLAGSGWRGAEFALAFGLGTVPLLWLAQAQLHLLKRRVSPKTMLRIQRSLSLVAAVAVAWRLHSTLPGFDSSPATDLPSCCH
ncbi:MAG: sulfite exporter TauE/SafE family protein [Luteolibacter sp.]